MTHLSFRSLFWCGCKSNTGKGCLAHYRGVWETVCIAPGPQNALNSRWGGTQNSYGHFGKEKIPWSYSP